MSGAEAPGRSTAQVIAERLHYPPEGRRSVVGGLPQFGFGSPDLGDAITAMNAAMLLIVMLETPAAIEQADAIAAVDGVDVVMIGTNDLAAASGIPGQVGHERIVANYETVAAACRRGWMTRPPARSYAQKCRWPRCSGTLPT